MGNCYSLVDCGDKEGKQADFELDYSDIILEARGKYFTHSFLLNLLSLFTPRCYQKIPRTSSLMRTCTNIPSCF